MTTSDPIAKLVTLAAEQDEVIKQAVRKLAFEVVHEAHKMLHQGSPATRLSVIRSLLPSLVRSLEKQEDQDQNIELQKQLAELMKEVRDGTKVVLEVTPIDPEEDTPHYISGNEYPKKLSP